MEHNLPFGVEPVDDAMVDSLAPFIRREHVREINAMFPVDGCAALASAVNGASVCYSLCRDQYRPLCIFGVGQVSPLTGSALGWLLGRREMAEYGMWIADVSRHLLPILHRESGARRIENWIPHDYDVALRWLTWLGFSVCGPEPVINGILHVHVLHDMEV